MRKPDCHPVQPYYSRGLCKRCYEKDRYQKNIERSRDKAKDHYYNNIEHYRKYYRDNAKRCTHQAREWYNRVGRSRYKERYPKIGYFEHINKRYGITKDQYKLMLANQNGLCAICGHPPNRAHLSVDHDHETGKIRGLLCTRCNTRLAALEDEQFMSNSFEYLTKHKSNIAYIG